MAYESRDTKDREHWLKMKQDALKRYVAGNRLTLEETSIAIWDPESEKQPMTCMGVLKIEKKALDKLKSKLKAFGIKDLGDVFEPKFREYGRQVSTVYDMP